MHSSYAKLAVALSINLVVMFLLTYMLLDDIDHLQINVNRIYMAVMMVAPMAVVMLLVMRSMFDNSRLNATLLVGSVVVFFFTVWLARSRSRWETTSSLPR